jgi:hypothetical protein
MHIHSPSGPPVNPPAGALRKFEPEHLGPLGPEPLPGNGAHDFFPGEERFLKASRRKKLVQVWREVAPIVSRLLGRDERILYAARATANPGAFHAATIGAMAYAYCQVLLILTDSRLVEILLDRKGKRADCRIRSFHWNQAKKFTVGFISVSIQTANGKKHHWNLGAWGDRRLLKLLAPHVVRRIVPNHAGAQESPVRHCPSCMAVCPTEARECGACRTPYLSPRLAAALSLAFPGAGVFYAGHPGLGSLILFVELAVFAAVAVILATLPPGVVSVGGVWIAAIAFVLIKLKGLNLGNFLIKRGRTETFERRERWKRMAIGGAAVSLVALSGAAVMAGKLANPIDHDLVFSQPGWSAMRDASELGQACVITSSRSEWSHPEGWTAFVIAHPLPFVQDFDGFRADFVSKTAQEGVEAEVEDTRLPAPLEGFRFIGQTSGENDLPLTILDYFVYDRDGRDVHQILCCVPAEQADSAQASLHELIASARWVTAGSFKAPASPPAGSERPAASRLPAGSSHSSQ